MRVSEQALVGIGDDTARLGQRLDHRARRLYPGAAQTEATTSAGTQVEPSSAARSTVDTTSSAADAWLTCRLVAAEPGDVVECLHDLARELDVLDAERPAQLRGGAGADDRRRDAGPVAYPGQRHLERREAEALGRPARPLDDAAAAGVEVGSDD